VAAKPSQPFWRRRLLPVVVIAAGLNLLVLVAFTVPRSWRLSRVASRAGSLREEVARERALTTAQRMLVDTAQGNARDLERFYRDLVERREESLLPTLEEIETMARQPGLAAGKRGYTREAIKDTPLTRVAIKLPLEGSYQNLVGFLEEVERGKRFLTVDKIALSPNRDDRGSRAKLQVELSAFFKEPAKADAHGG
jgi:Tfp pilus assembly protein PilO